MAKHTADEIKLLVEVLKRFPEGARIEEIDEHTGLGLQRRTLQRRLLKLKENSCQITCALFQGPCLSFLCFLIAPRD